MGKNKKGIFYYVKQKDSKWEKCEVPSKISKKDIDELFDKISESLEKQYGKDWQKKIRGIDSGTT